MRAGAPLARRRWPGWQVAVNVSGVQFRDGSLVSRVSRAIDAAGIDSRMIELEFTEGALIEYSAAVSKAVKSLKELGVATALDDFGTGYSSLSYLRHFPIDTLKIDRVFVRDIASKSGGNAPLVDAIIAMAKSLGLATVAEGVETEAQWQYLKTREANQVQGFLFCRPLADRGIGALARRLAACESAEPGERRITVRAYREVLGRTLFLGAAPDHFAAVFVASQHAGEHEQQIRQPVQVLEHLGRDVFDARQATNSGARRAGKRRGRRGRPPPPGRRRAE